MKRIVRGQSSLRPLPRFHATELTHQGRDESSAWRAASGGKKLAEEADFGAYHYSTRAASRRIRAVVRTMFNDALASLPFGRDAELEILDVGCGLGFLSCVCAEFYKNAQIIGIDTFEHSSLKRSSLENAKENARILGFGDRITFNRGDVFSFTPSEKFDIIVSNLVFHNLGFHNLGRRRLEAYSRLASWARADSFIVIGDLFFSPRTDRAVLSRAFTILRETRPESRFRQYALLVMSKS